MRDLPIAPRQVEREGELEHTGNALRAAATRLAMTAYAGEMQANTSSTLSDSILSLSTLASRAFRCPTHSS